MFEDFRKRISAKTPNIARPYDNKVSLSPNAKAILISISSNQEASSIIEGLEAARSMEKINTGISHQYNTTSTSDTLRIEGDLEYALDDLYNAMLISKENATKLGFQLSKLLLRPATNDINSRASVPISSPSEVKKPHASHQDDIQRIEGSPPGTAKKL